MTFDPMSETGLPGPPGPLTGNADRDRAIDVLKAGYAEGRLTKGEYDDRVARVYAARTYDKLESLIADLPAGAMARPVALYPLRQTVRPPIDSSAVAALACGVGVFLTMGLTAIPAIVLGHMARRQVRETGERGEGMALTGLVLGWTGIALMAVVIVGLIAVSVGVHGHPVPAPDNPGGPMKPLP